MSTPNNIIKITWTKNTHNRIRSDLFQLLAQRQSACETYSKVYPGQEVTAIELENILLTVKPIL